MIERNKNAAGRRANMLFGIANILDGLVRVLSAGFLHTRIPLELAKSNAKRHIKRLKEKV